MPVLMFRPGHGNEPPEFQTVADANVQAQRDSGWFVLGDEKAIRTQPAPRLARFNGLTFIPGTTGE